MGEVPRDREAVRDADDLAPVVDAVGITVRAVERAEVDDGGGQPAVFQVFALGPEPGGRAAHWRPPTPGGHHAVINQTNQGEHASPPWLGKNDPPPRDIVAGNPRCGAGCGRRPAFARGSCVFRVPGSGPTVAAGPGHRVGRLPRENGLDASLERTLHSPHTPGVRRATGRKTRTTIHAGVYRRGLEEPVLLA